MKIDSKMLNCQQIDSLIHGMQFLKDCKYNKSILNSSWAFLARFLVSLFRRDDMQSMMTNDKVYAVKIIDTCCIIVTREVWRVELRVGAKG